jgi:hypothetical protein
MNTAKKGVAKRKKNNYLTKRILKSAVRTGVRAAAEKTMRVMGYLVISRDGWIIKKHADGRVEKISKIEHVNRAEKIALD